MSKNRDWFGQYCAWMLSGSFMGVICWFLSTLTPILIICGLLATLGVYFA